MGETISLTTSDGHTLDAYKATPSGAVCPQGHGKVQLIPEHLRKVLPFVAWSRSLPSAERISRTRWELNGMTCKIVAFDFTKSTYQCQRKVPVGTKLEPDDKRIIAWTGNNVRCLEPV